MEGQKLTLVLILAVLAGVVLTAGPARAADVAEAAPREAIILDWTLQDAGGNAKNCFKSSSSATIEIAMVTRVLDELGDGGKALRGELTALTAAKAPGSDPRWRALYLKACDARRALRLKPLLAKWRKIVFTKHFNMGGSHYAYTEGQSDAQAERNYRPGTALCMLEMDGDKAVVRTLIQDAKGVIRDPDVSYDGKRILFAWKKDDRKDDYHLYEMEAATGKVRQLTFGLGYADYESCYLPNGDILFTSSRCVQIVDCWWTEVSNLYTCDKDGRFLRRLSFDQVHSNYPTVLDDGRVIYTRWDYNDRGQLYPQPLFVMNQDGTGQTEFYGNNSWFPTTIMHARGIPGTTKLVAIFSGHHSHQRGKLGIIDPGKGRQEATGTQLIAPVRETKAVRVDAYGQGGDQFQYPYPLSETEFVVTYTPDGGGNRRYKQPFGIYFMDIDGRREMLTWDPKSPSNQPVPLAPRKVPHVRNSTVDYRKKTGTFYVQDVYHGPGLKGIERGTVKRLRVVALEFRAVGLGRNGNGGPAGGALVSTPVSINNGTWDVKKVLGSVPVEADGSAFFEVPARTPVYFQLLDAKGHTVQSMRSWSTLQPGENFSCSGCHESKNEAPPSRTTQAIYAGVRKLEPFYGPARGFSFVKEIQPILDKHCIKCHNDRSKRRGAKTSKKAPKPAPALANAITVLPTASKWQYTTAKPAAGWDKASFDTSGWKKGRAGFGTKGTSGGTVYTTWNTPDIWLRTTFKLPANWNAKNKIAAVRFCHDEDVEIYVNACPVASAKGHVSEYKQKVFDASMLRPGVNVLAVHCRQTGGGQFIDVGLLTGPAPGAAKAPATPVVVKKPGIKKAFSLLGTGNVDGGAKRLWSDSYLALTLRGRPNKIVNWLNAQSIPPMLPPYYAGAAKSELITMFEKGHNNVKLSREDTDKIACWIDLLVPFCGDYAEANTWNDGDKKKNAYYQAKRKHMEEFDRKNIQALIAYQAGGPLPPAPSEAASRYRNVALNPNDVQGKAAGYPHASSNSEYGNNAAFAAKCAINGKTANRGHGARSPSWGPDRRKDLWWQVEFGKAVEIDKVVIHIRADFPHDRHWHSATLVFSDGSKQKITLKKTADPQTFQLAKRTVTWMKITDLVQAEPLGWCGLSEVAVWGRNAPASP